MSLLDILVTFIIFPELFFIPEPVQRFERCFKVTILAQYWSLEGIGRGLCERTI